MINYYWRMKTLVREQLHGIECDAVDETRSPTVNIRRKSNPMKMKCLRESTETVIPNNFLVTPIAPQICLFITGESE